MMHPKMKIKIYFNYAQNKIGDEYGNNLEIRNVIAMLISYLIDSEKIFPLLKNIEIISNKTNKLNLALLETFEKKTKWLKNKIFSEEEVVSLKNVCLIIRFLSIVVVTLEKYNMYKHKNLDDVLKIQTRKELLKNVIKIDDIPKWNGSECENEKEQKIAFIEQRAFIVKINKDFIKSKWKKTFSKMCIIPGRKTKLQQIMPQLKMLSIVLNDEGIF